MFPVIDKEFSQLGVKSNGKPYVEIVNPSGFVNTDGITIKELIGKKVILVDFLTYSCINCQRTFPYLNAWYAKYKDQGLEIIGIHTPEFAFEKDINNVREAMKGYGIMHPIVLDNNYATWGAYNNNYWPRKYLIDINGNIVYDHIGEGAYEETEMKIRELLEERAKLLGTTLENRDNLLVVDSKSNGANNPRSPETYFGSERNEYLKNGVSGKSGEQSFIVPTSYTKNALYLDGAWNIKNEFAETVSESKIIYRYNAKEVYIVAESDVSSVVKVFQDGKLVFDSAGVDVEQTRSPRCAAAGFPGAVLAASTVAG